ncbi:MAG: replication and repair protein RecF protein [candidate division TM6 bacterium GW2011_GWE2_41_16]|nr:MAG: replication and repair protein RecF protein [candidate division TM6 bacterium GW2011_GWE2_41_16]
MFLKECTLKNFRCFEQQTFNTDAKTVLIEGVNGSGKTALLEALFYTVFARSFRTSQLAECMHDQSNACWIKSCGTTHGIDWTITRARSASERVAKIGQQDATTKQILELFKVVVLTAHDMTIIQGYPEQRRVFLDTIGILSDPSYQSLLSRYRYTIKQKMALLKTNTSGSELDIWSERVWILSKELSGKRAVLLERIEKILVTLDTSRSEKVSFSLLSSCVKHASYEQFLAENMSIITREKMYGKILFGAHFDDFEITKNQKNIKTMFSRGQQKILLIFLKLAMVEILQHEAIVLVDDFITDFDQHNIEKYFYMLSERSSQLFITSPISFNDFSWLNMKTNSVKITL